jgi:hypothetical protein
MAERNPYGTDADGSPRPPGWRAEDARAERIDEIHRYLRTLRSERAVLATTTTASGQDVDWIPVESQTPDGRVADPPGPGRSAVVDGGDRQGEAVPFDLERPDAVVGPPGTVPVLRRPLELIQPDGTLQDFLSKYGRARRLGPPGEGLRIRETSSLPDHSYANASQLTAAFGTEGVINVWRPYVEWSDDFSLGQLWLSRGFGPLLQSVEVGVQTRRDSYGDWEPHVFVYFTTSGHVGEADFVGGYNTDVRGWVQVSTTRFPGGVVAAVSQPGGVQQEFVFKVQLFAGNWWVMVNGEWMGYYPGTLFSPLGMGPQADYVAWGGEVYESGVHPGTTGTDMGSGLFPWEGFGRAAYMRNLLYQSDPTGSMLPFTGIADASNPDCYDIRADFSSSTPWGQNFFWGGTGRNSACP